MIGALIDGKKLFYRWYDRLNALAFIQFCKELIASLPQGKYVFILDNAPAHKAALTKKYLATITEQIEVEFLLTYSPQLNCIETCWKIARHEVTSANFFKSIELLKKGIEQYLGENDFMLNPSNYLSQRLFTENLYNYQHIY